MLKSRFMFAAAMAACACALHAGRTIEADYTLEADEDWSSEGTVTINAGVVVNLNGHDLRVGGLAGEGRIVSSAANLVANGSFEVFNAAISGTSGGFAADGLAPDSWTYALGANNLANVTGVYYGTLLDANGAIWLGALSICIGVLTYGKQITDKVMKTVGKELVELTKFGSFLAVISMAIVMQIYAVIGIPVSSAMALVGGTLAIGIFRRQINKTSLRALRRTILGWIFTPIMGFVLSYVIYFVLKNFLHFA